MIVLYVNLFMLFFLAVNRRLDEWVTLEQLDLDSVEGVFNEKVDDKVMIFHYPSCYSFSIAYFLKNKN